MIYGMIEKIIFAIILTWNLEQVERELLKRKNNN